MKTIILEKFGEIYGDAKDVSLYFAPGRVNLIGEHTDYNGGHVFPCALTIGTYAAVRKRPDRVLRFYSMNFDQLGVIESSLDDLKPYEEAHWTNYPKGVMWAFEGRGMKIPAGSYYWGGRSAEEAAEYNAKLKEGEEDKAVSAVPFKFYYSKSGTQTWVPYGALIMTSDRGVEIDNPFTTTVNSDNGQNAKSLDADMSLMFVEEPNTTTGLDKPAIEIPVVRASNKVYNMNGQLVRDNARDLNSLGKGLYIVNGRKIVVK